MIAYFDTSALLKRYVAEPGSAEVLDFWDALDGVTISAVAYAEAMSAFGRKRRDGTLSEEVFAAAVSDFKADWETFDSMDVTARLNPLLDRLAAAHPLRGFDVIHLASALMFRERTQDDFLFASADQRLRRAAAAEGLQTFPET